MRVEADLQSAESVQTGRQTKCEPIVEQEKQDEGDRCRRRYQTIFLRGDSTEPPYAGRHGDQEENDEKPYGISETKMTGGSSEEIKKRRIKVRERLTSDLVEKPSRCF